MRFLLFLLLSYATYTVNFVIWCASMCIFKTSNEENEDDDEEEIKAEHSIEILCAFCMCM